MERLATGEEVGARATGRGLCGSIAGKLGKGDGETGEDREDESLKNKKYVVRSSSQKERKKEIEDGATGDWRLRGGGGDNDYCVGPSQGKGDEETGEEEDERTKKYLYF